jgi:hypothetical protein
MTGPANWGRRSSSTNRGSLLDSRDAVNVRFLGTITPRTTPETWDRSVGA